MSEKMPTFKEITAMLEEDLTISFSTLKDKVFEIPKLHSKYMRYYHFYYSAYLNAEKELNTKYRELHRYYTFEYQTKLSNAKEIDFHILSDDKYSTKNANVKKLRNIVDCLDRTLKKVDGLSFDVKNCIEYLKYMQGV